MYNPLKFQALGLLGFLIAAQGCSDTSKQPQPPNAPTPGLGEAKGPGPIRLSTITQDVGMSLPGLEYPIGPGDMAPRLQVTKFVHGAPFETFEKDKIYVINFWATFCGTCVQTMPQIAKLQDTYFNDVIIIGVTSEDEETVTQFLQQEVGAKSWSDLLTYRIALDDRDKTVEAYRASNEENNLPFVVIVGRTGVIEWLGHPATMLRPLESIVNGDWDYKAARAAMRQEINGQRSIDRHQRAIVTSVNAGNYREAVSLTDRMMKSMPDNQKILALQKQLLIEGKMFERLDKVLVKLVDVCNDDPLKLNGLAWEIAVEMDVPERNLDLALQAAKRASELTQNENTSILDTVARIHFERGEVDEAVQWQERAVDIHPENEELTKVLEKYRSAVAAEAPETETQN